MMTRELAEFAVGTDSEDVPAAAIEAACTGLVDTLACALAGSLEPVSRMAARWVRENGGAGRSSHWGSTDGISAADAAFANGISAHALDFDDSHPSARGHASASIVPTAIAVGESVGASGRDVLAAYAVGIEVAGRIGRAFGFGHLAGGWHPTATVGALASTAVAARLRGHDPDTLRRAWGLTGSEISGLVRNFGTMTKPFHVGHAARSAIVASWMAGAGLTADTEILDGEGGVFDSYGADGESPEELLKGLGKTWEIIEPGNYVKRWPCCYSNHRSIGALLRLIDAHRITAEEVEEVTVSFLPGGDKALVSREPKTGLEGKFSIEYVVAAIFLDGDLKLSTFTDEMVMRPDAQALAARVRRRTIPDEKSYSGLVGYNVVSIATPRGRFEQREDRTPGSPAWPLTADDRAAKFMDCATLALGKERAAALHELAEGCAGLADIAELTRMMRDAPDATPRKSAARGLR